MNKYPIEPTIFKGSTFTWDWYDTDYFMCKDGHGNYPDHHCKKTWIESIPFIGNKRNAVDVGCRDGEYARYLHKDFQHVFCFDYRRRKLFNNNVDLTKITHFKCALGEAHEVKKVSGGGSMTTSKVPKEKWYEEQFYTLDEFNLPDVDYIKIDVDGYELNVLKGSINTIKKYKPLLVLEQLKGEDSSIKWCETLGYEIAAWDNDNRNVIMRNNK